MVKSDFIVFIMKKVIFAVLLLMPLTCFGQFLGVGYQTANFDKNQFAANVSFPYYFMNSKDKAIFLMNGGLDFTTSGPKISGLNIKPVSLAVTNTNMLVGGKSTLMLRLDAGYNFNFTHGNDGVILTPNLYADYSTFYLTAGYDYNAIHNEGQFFVRLGVGLTWGVMKSMFTGSR